jgi:hypothetical protein
MMPGVRHEELAFEIDRLHHGEVRFSIAISGDGFVARVGDYLSGPAPARVRSRRFRYRGAWTSDAGEAGDNCAMTGRHGIFDSRLRQTCVARQHPSWPNVGVMVDGVVGRWRSSRCRRPVFVRCFPASIVDGRDFAR